MHMPGTRCQHRLKATVRADALVAGLLDVAAHKGPLRVLSNIEDRGVAGVLRLLDDGAPRLAGVLARVHEHHGLVPRLQAVDYLHAKCARASSRRFRCHALMLA